MQYTTLGRTGLKVSRICLGMMTYGTPRWRDWILDEEASRPLVRHAVELGINFFDTADLYSGGESEVLTGRFLREFCKREEAVVATKLFYPVDLDFKGGAALGVKPPQRPNQSGLSRKRIFHAVDESLRRLGTDYIDLYQIHRFDYETPMEETMEALHDVVKAGKVRYLGASSMYAWQFAKMQQIAKEHGWSPFVSMQNHYNLAYREEEREMIPLCKDQGVGLIPWSPLARGFLASTGGATTARAEADVTTQKFYGRPSDLQVRERLRALAAEKGVSPATLAYAWLLHKGVTSPIAGASKPSHIEDAVAAIDVRLTAAEAATLEQPYVPRAILGHA